MKLITKAIGLFLALGIGTAYADRLIPDNVIVQGGYVGVGSTGKIQPIYIRGWGYNQTATPKNRNVELGNGLLSPSLYTSTGLTLTIIDKTTQAIVSSTNYNTYSSTTASDQLATALNNLSANQIGILTSADAWEGAITTNLRTAFARLGLNKAQMQSALYIRNPYAAIFEGATGSTVKNGNAVEVIHGSEAGQPFAEIRGWLMDGSYVVTPPTTNNVLYDARGLNASMLVESDGSVQVRDRVLKITNTTGAASGAALGKIAFSTWDNGPGWQEPVNLTAISRQTPGSGWAPTDLAISTGYNNVPSERMRITYEGKVGIGTSAPANKLTLQGTDQYLLNVGGTGNGAIKVRHIDGKAYDSADVDNLYLQMAVNKNTIINADSTGNVGIGTASPTHKLTVNGSIRAKEVIVESNIAARELRLRPEAWADDVFTSGYERASLAEVNEHIRQNGHLPGVPSAAEVAEKGVGVAEMQAILLRKIEELTLHVIEQERRLHTLETENERLQAQLEPPAM